MLDDVPAREVEATGDCGLSGSGGGARSGSELSHLLFLVSLRKRADMAATWWAAHRGMRILYEVGIESAKTLYCVYLVGLSLERLTWESGHGSDLWSQTGSGGNVSRWDDPYSRWGHPSRTQA